ncbi:MAG TPA: hypothetical protein VGO60_06585 [Iamia sp.]|nr:hypothetical protein [Iamia sp.]
MTHPRLLLGIGVSVLALALLPACSDDGDSDAFCQRLGDTDQVGAILGELDASDPAGAQERLREGLEQFQDLEADAPGAIRDDVARIRQGVQLILESVEDHPDDLPAARQAIAGEIDELSGLAQAGEAVADYARDECGLDLEGDSEVETTTTEG